MSHEIEIDAFANENAFVAVDESLEEVLASEASGDNNPRKRLEDRLEERRLARELDDFLDA